jgi:D-alanine-D-alanine ligase
MKRILILHESVPENAPLDIQDVLVQANAVHNTCLEIGYQPCFQSVTSDLDKLKTFIEKTNPDVVFNLVEAIDGKTSLIHLVPLLLESMKIPFTGCGSGAMINTTDKTITKQMLKKNETASPAWQNAADAIQKGLILKCPVIIKPIAEDGSCGITDISVCNNEKQVKTFCKNLSEESVTRYFIEEYIDGREFNTGLIASGKGVKIFPPSEIKFEDFPEDKPRILNYASKWSEETFEYEHTVRCFDFEPGDTELLDKMIKIAFKCWQMLDLSGYARVDFRVDKTGKPWVLEVNANPCISPDSGFVAMAKQTGLSYTAAINQIIEAAGQKH